MNDSLIEAVARSSRELLKYGFSTEEFASLVQQGNWNDQEVLAVAAVYRIPMPGETDVKANSWPTSSGLPA